VAALLGPVGSEFDDVASCYGMQKKKLIETNSDGQEGQLLLHQKKMSNMAEEAFFAIASYLWARVVYVVVVVVRDM
jgi:hypothetical protein